MFVETLLRRVVALAEEYPGGEVPDRVLWEEPGDNHDEYIEAAKRLEGEGLVEKGTSDYATLRATEKGRKALEGFREEAEPAPHSCQPLNIYPTPLRVVFSVVPVWAQKALRPSPNA